MIYGPPIKSPLALQPAIEPQAYLRRMRPRRRVHPIGLSPTEMIERLLHKPGRRVQIISEPHGERPKKE